MNAIELGATLYFPATRHDLAAIAHGSVPSLRSAVVCLEDAVDSREIERALANLHRLLITLRQSTPVVRLYVRPRDPAMLGLIGRMPGIERIEGFVLPKINADNLPGWMAALPAGHFRIMPTIEGVEAFEPLELRRLRDQLITHRTRVTAVRIGGNDILGLLGTRRARRRTAYDGPLANVIRDIATTFIPAGFEVSAPVFEHYAEVETLVREVEIDIEHGLLTKTAIHPSQVATIQAAYRPSADDVDEARAILAPDADAVFGLGGSLCEPATHHRWATRVLARAAIDDVASVPANRTTRLLPA